MLNGKGWGGEQNKPGTADFWGVCYYHFNALNIATADVC